MNPLQKKPRLTVELLKREAKSFIPAFGKSHPELLGVTDGKKVGTYVEIKFNKYLQDRYDYESGNAASGIDFPELGVDMKATSIKQPQSSCPFKSEQQKIYGLGYHVLVFVYEKNDDPQAKTAYLEFKHVVFVNEEQTADWQATKGITDILARDGNKDDIVAFLEERMIPGDEIIRDRLADAILKKPPQIGFLTISNALQWRLQYTRVITLAGKQVGVENLLA